MNVGQMWNECGINVEWMCDKQDGWEALSSSDRMEHVYV